MAGHGELHPALKALLAFQAGAPPLSRLQPAEARRQFARPRAAFGTGPALPRVEDRLIRHAGREVPCRLYVPETPVGLCVQFHGGGWVLGELDDFDAFLREFARRSGCAILAVNYRLAPEHPFPAALDDAAAAIGWAAEEGVRELGLPAGLVLLGDSAGANIATVSALDLADRVGIRLQVLFYPVVDADFTRPSFRDFGEGYLLSSADMRWFFRHYAAPEQWRDPRIAPLHRADLAKAPPAWIAVAAHDVLADEGRAYARALAAVGVPVQLRDCGDLMHGFARMYAMADSANAAMDDAAAATGAAFKRA
ncbi:alpha/beta hydrolase [Roseomonas sp. BN140053]|uniref:alpha/beta hydrolase n=1 Tax=Roseomonas sp. BN140053 TaxID=3391898 RepID=UPI0039EBED41